MGMWVALSRRAIALSSINARATLCARASRGAPATRRVIGGGGNHPQHHPRYSSALSARSTASTSTNSSHFNPRVSRPTRSRTMHTSAGASPAAAGDASNPGGWTGTSRDVASLRQWLDANGVDANAFGVNGAKSLTDLAIEVERGETTLALDDVTNAPRRDVRVLRLLVTDETWPGQVLVEARQEWESGRVRYRNTPLSEKLLGNEDWRDAVRRAVDEELGGAIDATQFSLKVDESSVRRTEVDRESLSYPGLSSRYESYVYFYFPVWAIRLMTSCFNRYAMFTVTCEVKGLPEPTTPVEGSAMEGGELVFTSVEDTPSGWLKATWAWRRREEYEEA